MHSVTGCSTCKVKNCQSVGNKNNNNEKNPTHKTQNILCKQTQINKKLNQPKNRQRMHSHPGLVPPKKILLDKLQQPPPLKGNPPK